MGDVTDAASTRTSCCGRFWRCIVYMCEAVVMCTNTRRPYIKSDKSPLESANIFSRLFYSWASPLIVYAASGKKPVQLTDLWEMRKRETAEDSVVQLKASWEDELQRAAADNRVPSLFKAGLRTIKWSMLQVFLFKMGWLAFSLVSNALLLQQVILFFSSNQPMWYGIVLVFCFLFSELFRSISVNQHWLVASLMGFRLRSGIRQMMYDKLLKIRNSRMPVGTAVNMLIADTQRIHEASQYGEFLISTPITVVATLIIMWFQVGPSALAGFGVMLIFTPIQAKIGQYVGSIRRRTVKITDERAKVMTEVLNGIKLLKLYAWEAAFADKVANIRKREIKALTSAALIRSVNSVLAFSVPVVVTLATFTAYTLATGDALTPAAAFVCIALFNVARFPLGIMPMATKMVSEAKVAARRLQTLLQLPEVDPRDAPIFINEDADHELAARRWTENTGETSLPGNNYAMVARKASFIWSAEPELDFGNLTKPILTATAPGTDNAKPSSPTGVTDIRGVFDISFDIGRGECVAIVGSVGSGKSSLLSAFLGQMARQSGDVIMKGSVAYAAQSPWVFTGSVKDNILFGSAFDADKYADVVHACALLSDFAQFPAGDATEIGERGINLSGGQKARIALARALYSEKDIFLLDDPLSAVDVHVGQHLWRECIQARMVAKGKTVIIVTHQLQYIPGCSKVLVLSGGKMSMSGTYQELLSQGFNAKDAGLPEQTDDEVLDGPSPTEKDADDNTNTEYCLEVKPPPPIIKEDRIVLQMSPSKKEEIPAPAKSALPVGKLVADEERSFGAVSLRTVKAYFSATGSAWILVYLLGVLLLSKGARQVSDWWMSYWTSHVNSSTGTSVERFYLGMYAVTAAGIVLFTLVQSISFAIITLRASRVFHDRVFSSIMRAKSSWLDSQPTGRILSRFTGDLDLIDSSMPPNIEQASEYQIQVLLSIVLIIAIFPWFLIPLVPIAATFIFIAQYFRRAARDLKRLDNIARTPLVSHVQATMQGLISIRAYGMTNKFREDNCKYVDDASKAYWGFYAANRWVAVRLDVQTMIIASVTVALCIVAHAAGQLSPALAGLAVTQALQTTGIFQFSVRLLTEAESQLTSVERLNHYTYNIPHEEVTKSPAITDAEVAVIVPKDNGKQGGPADGRQADGGTSCVFPAWYQTSWNQGLVRAAWPWKGHITFSNVSVRYRDGLPLVLQGVSFDVPGGFKVGCVGRTGAGKTTITQTLFRLLELDSGQISIDGVDISSVNVYHLRSRLAIIPQDPTLYSGSLRANLDVFHEYSDEDVMRAVECAGLSGFVAGHPGGLQRPVTEGGGNISLGERQMIALTRALLRNAKVIVMDEATASIDTATDAAIQRTIRKNMAGSTLFIIAHRLHTIMDCDRVLVLDQGRVVEYDAPAALLGLAPRLEPVRSELSIFKSLVEQTGLETSSGLQEVSMRAYAAALCGERGSGVAVPQ